MTTQTTPAPKKAPKVNRIGLKVSDYKGAKSTLCGGCGHDVITNCLVRASFELGIEPEQMIKMSGIGCSSKTPTYFSSRSHGANGLHGRMPSMATGAVLANHQLTCVGISGDGDTASIGLGQFIHLVRRNVPMLYVIGNNGVYGLTKGQFSATADIGSHTKSGVVNQLPPVDLCTLALEMGCGFVARGFSGNNKQLTSIFKAAMCHRGTAVIDVLSPCVAFNNHLGSTKSYDYGKDNAVELTSVDFIHFFDHPQFEDEVPGETHDVRLYDGSIVRFTSLPEDYDPHDRGRAIRAVHASMEAAELLTGILYIEPTKPDLIEMIGLVPEPLATLSPERLRPSRDALSTLNAELSRR